MKLLILANSHGHQMSQQLVEIEPEMSIVNISNSVAKVNTILKYVSHYSRLLKRIDPNVIMIHVESNVRRLSAPPKFNTKPT